MRANRVLLPLALLLPLVAAAEEPLALLQRMADAVHKLNYEGTFVYVESGRLETMRIVHHVDESGEHERLVSLNGRPREVVSDDQNAVCILGDEKPFLLERAGTRPAFPASRVGDLSRLTVHYEPRLGGTVRSAGRHARVLEIVPRDDLRYGYRLWIDLESSLPLKSELVGGDGAPLEQMMFTELRVLERPDDAVRERIVARKAWASRVMRGSTHEAEVRDRRWTVSELPEGFQMTGYRSYRMTGDRDAEPVDHLVFSDGLAAVSVYVERVDDGRSLHGGTRLGAVSSYATRLDGHQVVVVGDVPMKTAHAIGSAVRPLDVTAETAR